MSFKEIHIGLDDIDSPLGGCTTHFASLLVEHLTKQSVVWRDYPRLIRLNPGIPFRTRGNGAVALHLLFDTSLIEELMEQMEQMVNKYVDKTYSNTNPGIVIITEEIPEDIRALSRQALWRTVPIDLARRLVKRDNIVHYEGGNGRGLIGALSAVGNVLEGDHTYEFIAYRSMAKCGQKRGVDPESVIEMVKRMGNRVFSNIDTLDGRILIEPHGPDPVIYGVRGETAQDVREAADLVRCRQNIDRWMVFRSNQGTGEHLRYIMKIQDLRPYMAAIVHGFVEKRPKIIEGGHVLFGLRDDNDRIDCAAYEPTRGFREIIKALRIGDEIRIHANVRPSSRSHGRTLNVEGLETLNLTQETQSLNPFCPHCLKRMKSAGSDKGYKCFKCGFKDKTAVKIETQVERSIKEGLYLPPLSAQRHLTRPRARLELRNSGKPLSLINNWHGP
jgi:tRNA(Ile2)-agmatinylcytidine synthase